MLKGLYTSYSGLINEQSRLDVLTNNLANATTNGYKAEVEKAYKIVDRIAIEKPNRLQDALTIAERFSKVYAEWKNKGYSIEMMCPSVMISGGSNFPVQKKHKQNARRDKHMDEYNYIMGIPAKIESILYGRDIIKSKDKVAVEQMFYEFTDVEFADYLKQCVNEITK